MSTTVTRNYKAGSVWFPYEIGNLYMIGTESLPVAVQQDRDNRYFGFSGLAFSQVLFTPLLDGVIPAGATLDEISISLRAAVGKTFFNTYSDLQPIIASDKLVLSDPDPATPGPNSGYLSFTDIVPFEEQMEIKDLYWVVHSNAFTENLPTIVQLENGVFGFGIHITDMVPAGIFYVDEVDFGITFTLTPTVPTSVTAYETTPYSAKVRASVNTGSCINSTYPMTAWFEWTALDPTNADDLTDFPIETTPVQTFTSDPPAHPDGKVGQFIFYDTLPSPLDVQNPNSRLQPNTTYWVRAATAVNGETLYSTAWTSFTTPSNDKVVL